MMTAIEIAIGYHKQGIPVMPITSAKKPIIKQWQKFADGQTEEDVRKIFRNGAEAIGFVLPKGWVAIDIDQKYEILGRILLDEVKQVLSDHDVNPAIFPIQQTPSGGWHIIFRSPVVSGNKVLASRPYTTVEMDAYNNAPGRKNKMRDVTDRSMALIETREYGGQIAIYPSSGYKMIQRDLKDAPMLTKQDYHKIMDLCRMFDETLAPAKLSPIPGAENSQQPTTTSSKWEVTPIDDYIHKATDSLIMGLLESNGYEKVMRNPAKVHYKRPGKDTHSKDYCGNYQFSSKVFYNFSPNSDFGEERGYSAFAVLAILQFRGDFSKAGKYVMDQGFGILKERPSAPTTSHTGGLLDGLDADRLTTEIDPFASYRITDASHAKHLAKRASENTYQVGQPIEEPNWYWFYEHRRGAGVIDRYDIAANGMMVAIVGPPKSRKSLLIASIIGAGLSGKNYIGWNIDFPGPVLFVDTEQPKYDFDPFCKKIESMCGSRKHDFVGVRAKGWSYKEVYHETIRLCEQLKPSVLFLDNVRHLVRDYNDVERTNALMDMLSILQAHLEITVCPVLHVNRYDGKSKGHTGTALDEQCNTMLTATLIDPVNPESASKVWHTWGRQKRFHPFGFTHGKNGLPTPFPLTAETNVLMRSVI